jgi:UDP-glucose 4-epimerase
MTKPANPPPPTTLVTGGCGFIGYALCHRLAAAGHRVAAYDDLSRGRAENLPEGTRLIQGDIRDRVRLAEAVSAVGPDAVVHLAAIHYLPDCAARPRETHEVNVEGTRRLLEACRGRVRHVVFASTAAVYAPVEGPCAEDRTPVVPIEVYGESKLAGERLVEAFCREAGVAGTTVRISNAIGRRETNPHVVPHIFESLRGSSQVPLGSIEARRDYIDTRDIAGAILALLDAAAGYRVFNVGTGVAHSVEDIVGLVERILGRRIEIVRDASRLRPVERMLLVSDIGKIGRATGWAPRITLEDSLRDLADAYGLRSDVAGDADCAQPTRTPAP